MLAGNEQTTGVVDHNMIMWSVSFLRYRLNDVLLRVNNVDVANASKETVMEAMKAASNIVNLRIRRKKHIGRFNISVDLTLNKRGLYCYFDWIHLTTIYLVVDESS